MPFVILGCDERLADQEPYARAVSGTEGVQDAPQIDRSPGFVNFFARSDFDAVEGSWSP